jgi:hypothetical protein
MVGDLVLTIARQAAELDAQRQQLAAATPAAPSEPKP